ncbi:MAG: hypothetical protein JF886_11365 [Candidatus Dormibacteraeota bacterium]|uniref:Uncharacterized protein n=1 Tax=Candidatus Aeolococcus gillhamiae TaxID=3127015 RepID=A0A2W6AJ46_9BACT|nr:hypothetical protein [Candidatus Dormibacteraeota bacterium]PZR83644.1 MAG: hypothetical protein DLM65_01455 [Candidatus Dormibacter sp. RRmetagenome_bin12]
MADAGTVGRLRLAAELLLLRRLPPLARVAVLVVVGAACGVLGAWSLTVQHHYASQAGGGRLAALLAHGSSVATAWEGWAAALFFLAALLRLRRGAPEPPAGRTPVEELTLGQLRAGLVREYTIVRAGLVIISIVSLVDAARAARYVVAAVSGDRLARSSLAATLIEAAGLLLATVVLALWAATFRQQLDRIGAL